MSRPELRVFTPMLEVHITYSFTVVPECMRDLKAGDSMCKAAITQITHQGEGQKGAFFCMHLYSVNGIILMFTHGVEYIMTQVLMSNLH